MHAIEPGKRQHFSRLGLRSRMDAWRGTVVQVNNRQGNLDRESGASAFALTCGCYHTAVQFHELLADRQPQPEATKGPRGRGIFLRESIKNVRKEISWNANAGIADAQFQMRIHSLEQRLYLASLQRELDRVGQQVPYDLLQARTVTADDVLARSQNRLQADALGLCRWLGGLHGSLYDTGK